MSESSNRNRPPEPQPQPAPDEAAAKTKRDTEAAAIASLLGMPAQLLSDMEPKTLQLLLALKATQGKDHLSGEQLAQLVSNAVSEAVRVMREPTPDELERQTEEQNRLRQARLNAAAQGKAIEEQIRREQQSCSHTKPNNDHTFRGQTHSDGWAEVKCIRCLIRFRVRPTPDMMSQGLNLDQIRGLTIQHLAAWARNSKRIDEHVASTQRQTASIQPFAGVEEEAITGL